MMPIRVQDLRLQDLLQFRPAEGIISLATERMAMVSATAWGMLRREIINTLGMELARGLFRRYGYIAGRSEAEQLKNMFEWETEGEWAIAGAVLHRHEGWGNTIIERFEFDRHRKTFLIVQRWENHFEVEEHLKHFGPSDEPVCWLKAGYTSGYATVFFGREVLCVETSCRAQGDAACRATLKAMEEWGPEASRERQDLQPVALGKELEELSALLRQQQQLIRLLSTPAIQVWPGILAMPLIGEIDSARARQITEQLLQAIVHHQADVVILDVTGVPFMNQQVADYLLRTIRAAELLGSRCFLVGIRPATAKAIVQLGIDFSSIVTYPTLQEGLQQALSLVGYRIVPVEGASPLRVG